MFINIMKPYFISDDDLQTMMFLIEKYSAHYSDDVREEDIQSNVDECLDNIIRLFQSILIDLKDRTFIRGFDDAYYNISNEDEYEKVQVHLLMTINCGLKRLKHFHKK